MIRLIDLHQTLVPRIAGGGENKGENKGARNQIRSAGWKRFLTPFPLPVHGAKDDTDVPPSLLEKAWFTLARTSRIKWEGESRDQIRDYLLDFAEERMERIVVPKVVAAPRELTFDESPVSTPADLAHVAVWAVGKIAADIPSRRLAGFWRPTPPSGSAAHKKLRWSILRVLDDHFADPSIPELVKKLGEMKPVAPDEVIDLERIRRKHELSRFKDQKQAWEYVWSVTNRTGRERCCRPSIDGIRASGLCCSKRSIHWIR